MEDSDDDGGSASSFASSASANASRSVRPKDTPLSPYMCTSNSPASSACSKFARSPDTPNSTAPSEYNTFSRSPPPEPNNSASESHVCKAMSMHELSQFATAKAVSMLALKKAAKRLGLVVTMGSRSKKRYSRIGFGVKKKVRIIVEATTGRKFPVSLFKFNQRKDGFLHPGTNR